MPKPDWSNLEKFRAARAGLEEKRLKGQGTPAPGFEEKFRTIRMRDGFESRIKIHKPVDTTGPLIVLVFGGGFIVGNDEQLTPLGRATAKAFRATTITISYRLAPEHKFPTPAHDVEDSLLWIASNASELGADPTKGFVLGGISAGGMLWKISVQRARYRTRLTTCPRQSCSMYRTKNPGRQESGTPIDWSLAVCAVDFPP